MEMATLYGLNLPWIEVFSDWNIARLDGNTVPPVNAKGKAHDDHKSHGTHARRFALVIMTMTPMLISMTFLPFSA